MWTTFRHLFAAVLAMSLGASSLTGAGQHDHHAVSTRLTAVHLATSCKPAVAGMFDRGVTLLHAFWFDAAIKAFRLVAHSDVDCSMAWWGIALAQWGDPFATSRTPEMLEAGRRSVAAAHAARTGSPREREYVAAVAALYADSGGDDIARWRAYARTMQRLSTRFPDDLEAAAFSAMAALPGSRTAAERQGAAGTLESLYRRHADHPGLTHYMILAFDGQTDASRGVRAAERYAEIAPPAAYPLHVPSHVFTRLGRWDASIDANLSSADAARRDGAAEAELHALDYQVHAFLQAGRDEAARAVLPRLAGLRAQLQDRPPSTVGWLALASIPARVALERGDWAGAAELEIHPSPSPQADALTLFARGLGAARCGRADQARQAWGQLTSLRERLEARGDGEEGRRVGILALTVEAFTLAADGSVDAAVGRLTSAAADDDRLELPADMPGSLAPPRELLGELLLEQGKPAEALQAFERTLVREPNRRRALDGAARAARALARTAVAAH